MESKHLVAEAPADDFVQADKRATADEQDFFGVDLDIFLVWMLASALWRNIAAATLQDLQQCLLYAFTGDISSDADIVCFASNLIDLVDRNDPDLGAFNIVIGVLQQT